MNKTIKQFCEAHNLHLEEVTYKGFKRKGYNILNEDVTQVLCEISPRQYRPMGIYAQDKWCIVYQSDGTNDMKIDYVPRITKEVLSRIIHRLEKRDPYVSRRRGIKVTFADGNSIKTPINGTVAEIRNYYLGKSFLFPKTEAVKVDFLY